MKERITLPMLAKALAVESGHTPRQCEEFIRELFALSSEVLKLGEDIKLRGLGTFRIVDVEERKSINVATGEDINIPGHKKVSFVPSPQLASLVNYHFEIFDPIELGDEADVFDDLPDDLSSEVLEEEILPEERPSADSSVGPEESDIDLTPATEVPDIPAPEIVPAPVSEVVSASVGQITTTPAADMPSVSIPEAAPAPEDDLLSTPEVSSNPGETSKISFVEDSEDEGDDNEIEGDDDDDGVSELDVPYMPAEDEKDVFDRRVEEEQMRQKLVSPKKAQSDVPSGGPLFLSEKNSEEDGHPANSSTVPEVRTKHRGRFIWGLMTGLLVAILAGVAAYYYGKSDGEVKKIYKVVLNKTETAEYHDSMARVLRQRDSIEESAATRMSSTVAGNGSEADIAGNRTNESEVATNPSDKSLAAAEVSVDDVISTTRFLTTMAREHYGNDAFWPYIYEENSKILGHPDRIKPGTKVKVPPLSKYGVNPRNAADIRKAKQMGVQIYKRFSK